MNSSNPRAKPAPGSHSAHTPGSGLVLPHGSSGNARPDPTDPPGGNARPDPTAACSYETLARHVATFELSGIIKRETANAVLFSDGILEEWIPKKFVIDRMPIENGLTELHIPEWLAIERGFA